MRKLSLVLVACLAILAGSTASPVKLPKGSAARKQVLDAIRPDFERYLGQKLIFEVDIARGEGRFVFVRVIPRQPNGKPLDYRRTRFAEAYAHGGFSDGGEALAKRVDGHWRVLAWEMGHTDVGYVDWPTKYGCSYALLGMPNP